MTDWRRIDIDALEPEKFLTKEELVPDLPATLHAQVVAVSQQTRAALSQGKFQEALQAALENPPYVADDQSKELHAETVFEVLLSIRNNHSVNELSQFVKHLDRAEQDTLVKYLYKSMSMASGTKQGGLLLNWFEKTTEVTGLGPVVRYITDRRTV